MREDTYIDHHRDNALSPMHSFCALATFACLLVACPAIADETNPGNADDKYPWRYDKSILEEISVWMKTAEFT